MDSQRRGRGFTEASSSRRCLGSGRGWTSEQRRMLQGCVLLLLPAEASPPSGLFLTWTPGSHLEVAPLSPFASSAQL